MLDFIRENLHLTANIQETSPEAVIASMLVAVACGAVIYVVYRFFYRGVVYSENFNILNVLICLVTAFIIKTIGTNLVLSLGMVGALSIVRFRAAVKDPLDVGFLFWGVAAGLTAGAQLYGIALLCTAFIAFIFVAMSFIKLDKRNFLLIVKYPASSAAAVLAELNKTKYKLKNKTITGDFEEITADVKIKKNDADIASKLGAVKGVISCVLLEYSGDYAN
jgi:hypothetical protein